MTSCSGPASQKFTLWSAADMTRALALSSTNASNTDRFQCVGFIIALFHSVVILSVRSTTLPCLSMACRSRTSICSPSSALSRSEFDPWLQYCGCCRCCIFSWFSVKLGPSLTTGLAIPVGAVVVLVMSESQSLLRHAGGIRQPPWPCWRLPHQLVVHQITNSRILGSISGLYTATSTEGMFT